MGVQDHPSLSGMTDEQKAQYEFFNQFANKNAMPKEPTRSKVNSTEELVYIDRDTGIWGDASGLLIVRISDMGESGRVAFEKAKDQAENLFTWTTGYLEASSVPVGMTFISKTSKLFPANVVENSKGLLGKLRGRK